MNKEEEIQEMARVLCGWNGESEDYCIGCYYCENGKCSDTNAEYAEILYNAGYRKADEVRKETAINVLRELRDEFVDITAYAVGVAVADVDHTEIGVIDVIDIIDGYLEKYGVKRADE